MGEPLSDFMACARPRAGDQLRKTVPCPPGLQAAIGLVTAADFCSGQESGDWRSSMSYARSGWSVFPLPVSVSLACTLTEDGQAGDCLDESSGQGVFSCRRIVFRVRRGSRYWQSSLQLLFLISPTKVRSSSCITFWKATAISCVCSTPDKRISLHNNADYAQKNPISWTRSQ